MRKKNGFTMIELLAIIVILAIIALIAIPVVLNIIDKVRVASYARSADNILDASRIYFKETQIDSTMSIEGNNYNKVMESISGRKPDSGEIYIKKNGDIAIALKYDKYCYKKGYSDVGITQTESTECSLAAELDENAPIIMANNTNLKLCPNQNNLITSYFKIEQNGAAEIESTTCISDKDGVIENTNKLSENTHSITCTAAKANGKSASANIDIKVEVNKIGKKIIGGETVDVVDSCDGLYLDSDGVYRYKGANPNNYIMLGSEEYRIMAIEEQGIKVIRSSNSANGLEFDGYYNRPSSTNTYCTNSSYFGCNIWAPAKTISQKGTKSDTIDNGVDSQGNSISGTVTKASTVYTYLHDTYYSNLSSVDKYIVKKATWNVGPAKQENTMLLTTVKEEEDNWIWNGKIGLMTYSEYIQAQSPSSSGYTSCSSNIRGNTSCGTDNWLNLSKSTWTITSRAGTSDHGWSVGSHGSVIFSTSNNKWTVRPVVYLSPDITLSGSGTQGSGAFTISSVDSSN